jgi:ethanolamine utilization microcompartment shell protein EutS
LLITGSLSAVESSLEAVVTYAREQLGFGVCAVTKT